MKLMKLSKILASTLGIGAVVAGLWFVSEAAVQTAKVEDKQVSRSTNQVGIDLVDQNIPADGAMTPEELAQYDGMNGNPAYIAVDGIVYDVSGLTSWANGNHMGYQAGADLSEAFALSPHSRATLDSAVVIGTYAPNGTAQKPIDNTSSNPTTGIQSQLVDSVTSASTQPASNPQTSQGGTNSQSTASVSTSQTNSAQEFWTLDKVAAYNGMNGNPAYIVVSGTIYDVTSLGAWSGGSHKGYQAGADLTAAFASSPHAMSILDNASVIANIGDALPTNTPSQGTVSNPQSTPSTPTTPASTPSTTTTPTNTTPTNTASDSQGNQPSNTGDQVWTLDKIASYNGMNGNPAYIVVSGTIYDVTSLGAWSGGSHKGYQAGADLTAAFASSPHAMSILDNAPVIGNIGDIISTGTVVQPVVNSRIEDEDDDDHDDDHDDHDDDDHEDDDHDRDHDDEDDDHDDHDRDHEDDHEDRDDD